MIKHKLLLALFMSFCITTFAQQAPQKRSLPEKAARMLIVGMRGTELTPDNPVIKDIQERKVGGIILFEHNITPTEKKLNSIERLQKLCSDLQNLTDEKLIISIDQEGGKVNRLKTKYGFPDMVSQQYLGQTDNEDTTRYYAGIIADQLKMLGFNTNFTPCVDVNINPDCPVIGKVERSFSSDPAKVAHHSMLVIDEQRKRGIYTAVKHFPGHGSSRADSHKGFTDVTDTWQESELFPYYTILGNKGCDMVMISHVFNRNMDAQYPATLSQKIITGILREELDWDGIVITDDMHMKAITDLYSLEESLVLTINAGTDMIILSSNIPGNTEPVSQQAIDAIVHAVETGAIPMERIDEANRRIDTLLSKEPQP